MAKAKKAAAPKTKTAKPKASKPKSQDKKKTLEPGDNRQAWERGEAVECAPNEVEN